VRKDIKNLLEKVGLKDFVYYDLHERNDRIDALGRWAMLRAVQRYIDASCPQSEQETSLVSEPTPQAHSLLNAVAGAVRPAPVVIAHQEPIKAGPAPAEPNQKPVLKLLGSTQRYVTEREFTVPGSDTGAETN